MDVAVQVTYRLLRPDYLGLQLLWKQPHTHPGDNPNR